MTTFTPVGPTGIGPSNAPDPAPNTSPAPQEQPSSEDQDRFAKALDRRTSTDEPNRDKGEGSPSSERPLESHQSLFRRREAPAQQNEQSERGGRGESNHDALEQRGKPRGDDANPMVTPTGSTVTSPRDSDAKPATAFIGDAPNSTAPPAADLRQVAPRQNENGARSENNASALEQNGLPRGGDAKPVVSPIGDKVIGDALDQTGLPRGGDANSLVPPTGDKVISPTPTARQDAAPVTSPANPNSTAPPSDEATPSIDTPTPGKPASERLSGSDKFSPGPEAATRPELSRRGSSASESDRPKVESAPLPTADMILRNLAPPPDSVGQAQSVQVPQRPEATMADLVREVADRIMVGESGPAGQQEVRIILKDQVLGGTEIRISEHAGAVHVTFVAGTKDAEGFLSQRQGEIATALSDRLDREVRIEVTDPDGQAQPDDARGERQQQEQNDGRSRNRRRFEDENGT
jgi:type III secretion system needle length determinant